MSYTCFKKHLNNLKWDLLVGIGAGLFLGALILFGFFCLGGFQ